jgi:hypothetical protein
MGAGSPKFATTLIILDEDNLVEWAQKNRVQFGSYRRSESAEEKYKALIDDMYR